MTQPLTPDSPSKGRLWAGRILSAIPVLLLVMSATMKLRRSPEVVQGFAKFGYAESTLLPIGLVELFCVLLYALPWTGSLGAVLLTGYLGGAVATHVRAGDPFIAPLAVGVLLWAGLYLRDPRLRVLLPSSPTGINR